MGDFANDAVWESMEAEFDRDINRDSHSHIPHPMFDTGCFDKDSLTKDCKQLSMTLDGFAGMSEKYTYRKKHWTELLNDESLDRLCKYLLPWEMRLGMAKQVMNGRPLTEKQKKWMGTNWNNGANDFEETFTKHPRRFIAIKGLELIVNRIQAIIEAKSKNKISYEIPPPRY